MKFEDLSPEQLEKARECETVEERMEFAAADTIELTDEQLEGIAGGRRGVDERTGFRSQVDET